jgi:hypothetical protein
MSIACCSATRTPPFELASGLPPVTVGVTERCAHTHIDVARAYRQWGILEPCYRCLLGAYQTAPEEVAGRTAIRGMAPTMLSADHAQRLSGLRLCASHVGAA